MRCFSFLVFGRLTSEVVKENVLGSDAEAVEQVENALGHHWGTAHEVLYVFGCIVVFEVGLVHYIVDEAGNIFHACCICCGIGTVESKMEVEIREILLNFGEVFKIEGLDKRTRAVEEMYLTTGLESLEELHDVAAERCHAGAAAHEDVFLIVGIVLREEELSVRTADHHLVTRLAVEDE